METAVALKMSPGSSTFRTLLSAAINYGLTEGSYQADRVALKELGRTIVEPTSDADRKRGLVAAALTPPTFRRIYQYFRGKRLPDKSFFENTVIREFDVPRDHARVCVAIFERNMRSLGLVRETKSGPWLSTEAMQVSPTGSVVDDYSDEAQADLEMVSAREGSLQEGVGPSSASDIARNAIFVGHGKNKRPLEQLKQILDQYRIPHKIAVDEPNKGRPISQKVADLMKECGAGILIFTADEEFKDETLNTVWKPSENVVFELGAASVLYGAKIIVFKEEIVDFPTNYHDIGYISFEKDSLSAKTNELFRELIAFGLIKVAVAGA
jgi:predicted nucleotide-binding protein